MGSMSHQKAVVRVHAVIACHVAIPALVYAISSMYNTLTHTKNVIKRATKSFVNVNIGVQKLAMMEKNAENVMLWFRNCVLNVNMWCEFHARLIRRWPIVTVHAKSISCVVTNVRVVAAKFVEQDLAMNRLKPNLRAAT